MYNVLVYLIIYAYTLIINCANSITLPDNKYMTVIKDYARPYKLYCLCHTTNQSVRAFKVEACDVCTAHAQLLQRHCACLFKYMRAYTVGVCCYTI